MDKKKRIVIISIAVVLAAGVIALVYAAGKGISGSLSGRSAVQADIARQENEGQAGQPAENSGGGVAGDSRNTDGESQDKAEAGLNGTTDGETAENNEDKGEFDKQKEIEEKIKAKKEIKVKALYLSGPMAGLNIDHFIDLVNKTELNALVIDIKENGMVNYESEVPEVKNNGLFEKYYDVDELIKKLHDNNIYVIGRIVCFRDNGLATKRPDLAIKRPNGSIWRENGKIAWLNPYLEESWRYNIEIAKEAVDKGFDEIQFDYVRFPTAGKSEVDYGPDVPSRADAICKFLEIAKKELHDEKGAIVSADVFAIICESIPDGLAIGQDLERIGKDIDYICPMIYPSHYANAAPKGYLANGRGQTVNGVLFTAPDLKPYDVVYHTLIKTKDRISRVEGYNAKVRPYLQDFTASYLPEGYYEVYGPEQVRQQIKAVYDAGFEEWILWDGNNTYSEGALLKE